MREIKETAETKDLYRTIYKFTLIASKLYNQTIPTNMQRQRASWVIEEIEEGLNNPLLRVVIRKMYRMAEYTAELKKEIRTCRETIQEIKEIL